MMTGLVASGLRSSSPPAMYGSREKIQSADSPQLRRIDPLRRAFFVEISAIDRCKGLPLRTPISTVLVIAEHPNAGLVGLLQ